MSILEGQGNVVGTENLVEKTLAWCAVVLEGFIHHVPSVDTSAEVVDNGIDMFAHALLQHFCADQVALFVVVEPGGTLGVPDEAVTQHLHAGGLGFVDKLVGQREVVDTLFGMDDLTLHTVFGHHIVEVLGDDVPIASLVVRDLSSHIVLVGAGQVGFHLPLVDADTRVPIVAVGVL